MFREWNQLWDTFTCVGRLFREWKQLWDTFTCVGWLICPKGCVSSLNKSSPVQSIHIFVYAYTKLGIFHFCYDLMGEYMDHRRWKPPYTDTDSYYMAFASDGLLDCMWLDHKWTSYECFQNWFPSKACDGHRAEFMTIWGPNFGTYLLVYLKRLIPGSDTHTRCLPPPPWWLALPPLASSMRPMTCGCREYFACWWLAAQAVASPCQPPDWWHGPPTS